MTKLHHYLRRIGYGGPLSVSSQTLHDLHRAHLLAIPFENIDVQRGRTPSLALDDIFEKLVVNRRGGWCFEMNGLFAWALRELGFRVDLLGAAVGRDKRGDAKLMNHLTLLVHLDEPYLADVGFGNGTLTPFPYTRRNVCRWSIPLVSPESCRRLVAIPRSAARWFDVRLHRGTP